MNSRIPPRRWRLLVSYTSQAVPFVLAICAGATPADAQILKKLGNAVGSVVNTGVKVATAPTQVLINTGNVVLNGGSASQIYKPYQDAAASAGQSIQNVAGVAATPQDYLYREVQSFTRSAGGNAGVFIFDVGTFTHRYFNQLGMAGAQSIGGVLQGQNPLQVSAAPLAAALRAAREQYAGSARPLPEDVKSGLRNHFSASTLNRARYTVGNVEITLPNFIGRAKKLGGTDYAVVVGEIIVFNTQPPSFGSSSEAAWWWAHEVTHVQQYEAMGYEAFAYAYLVDAGSRIEGEANSKANQVIGSTPAPVQAQLAQTSYNVIGPNPGTVQQAQPERYVAQAVFPADPFPVNYLLTNYGRIIAVDPVTGQWLHIGYAMPPLAPGVAWTYQTPNLRYAVLADGRIFMDQPVFDQWRQLIGYQPVQIGHVVRFQ